MPKKTKPRTTVNVDAVKKDVNKLAKDAARNAPPTQSHAELPPGSVQRQSPLEQELGTSKYHQMIHDHNEKNKHILDRLPFTFPKKRVVRSHLDIVIECVGCGHQSIGSEHTYGFSCPECKQYRRVKNPEAEKRGEDSDFKPGIFATASDILRMREERDKKN
jgi:hypothetical protein